jgi:hypothetical protein
MFFLYVSSWQTCIWWSLCSCMSIRGTHLAQTLRYYIVANIIFNALNQTFNSVQSSLVAIRRMRLRAEGGALHFVSWQLCRAARYVACISHHSRHCWNAAPITSLCSHPLFDLRKRSASADECQRVNFFPMEELNDTPLLRTDFHVTQFCQTVPLLLSIARQQNVQTIGGKVQPLPPYH